MPDCANKYELCLSWQKALQLHHQVGKVKSFILTPHSNSMFKRNEKYSLSDPSVPTT